MKRLVMLSVLTGVLSITGCSTVKNVFGIGGDTSAMNQTTKAVIAHDVPVTSRNGILVDSADYMTLYTFDKDTPGKSNCNGDCLAAWPGLVAPSNAKAVGQYSIIQRDDGMYQWAVNGMPLYFFVKDTKAGDTNGDKVKGVWHVVATQ